MKRIFLLLMSIFLINQIQAQDKIQSKLSLIQGIWENIMNNDNEKSFVITKGMNSLNFTYMDDLKKLDFPLGETIKGFQDRISGSDSINVKSLKEDGKYYTVIFKEDIRNKGWVHSSDFITPEDFECDGQNMSINGGQLVEYAKIDRLPNLALKMLLGRGKLDKRNYLKEYLGVDVREVKVAKSIINSNPGILTKMYLLKGDVLTILEEKGDWIKIEFEGKKLVQGWVKKLDVE